MKKKRNLIIVGMIVLAIMVLVGGSYAYFKIQLSGTKQQVVQAGDITLILDEGDDLSAILASHNIPMKDEDGMETEEFTFSIQNPNSNDVGYTLYIVDDALTEGATRVADSNIKYYMIKDEVAQTPALLSTLTKDETGRILDSGVISGNNTTINYSLRFWLDYNAGNEVMAQEFSVKLLLVAEQTMVEDSVSNFVFSQAALGDKCTTYDDGVDTFLVGQCSKNYVWYSGKLWRVVLKNNETGAVKMVTDNAITAIPYNASGNPAFENSYMDQWLNQEFLPTLHDYEDYLVTDYLWDATEDASDEPARPNGTTTVERTVGLLNVYEYYTTYAASGGLATYETGYLNIGIYWWLLTPYSQNQLRDANDFSNKLSYTNPASGISARPTINLKSDILIEDGTGVQSDPYILKGDEQETIAGTTLLSTRYSGEYVTFNNELYRIVNVEDDLTKITAVNSLSSLSGNVFDSSTTNFANASIKIDLENYYQGLKTTNESAYNMIQPNTTWYLGTIYNTSYKAGICASVDASVSALSCTKITDTAKLATASIALPRVGEMFTSQITRGSIVRKWTLTPFSGSKITYINNYGADTSALSGTCDAFPSMYLKSNVVIATNNTGNGTYEYPYSIELGA